MFFFQSFPLTLIVVLKKVFIQKLGVKNLMGVDPDAVTVTWVNSCEIALVELVDWAGA